MALNVQLLSLFGLIILASCCLGQRAADYYFNGGLPEGDLSYGYTIMHPPSGAHRRSQRLAAADVATMSGIHNARMPDGRQEWGFFISDGQAPVGAASRSYSRRRDGRGFSERLGRPAGDGVRTEVNYAAGKQPIVLKVSPRPYQPLPEVVRPLGGGRPGQLGRPGLGERPFGGRPQRRPPIDDIALTAGAPPRRRPGFVVRDGPPPGPPFPETVTGRPYRRPGGSGLREVYRAKPTGVFYVQGRENPNRRGLLAAGPETPLFGGRMTMTSATGPSGDGLHRFTNAHKVSRVGRLSEGGRRGRLLSGWRSGLLGLPETGELQPSPVDRGPVRFRDTVGIRVTPAGRHGLISRTRTVRPQAGDGFSVGPTAAGGVGPTPATPLVTVVSPPPTTAGPGSSIGRESSRLTTPVSMFRGSRGPFGGTTPFPMTTGDPVTFQLPAGKVSFPSVELAPDGSLAHDAGLPTVEPTPVPSALTSTTFRLPAGEVSFPPGASSSPRSSAMPFLPGPAPSRRGSRRRSGRRRSGSTFRPSRGPFPGGQEPTTAFPQVTMRDPFGVDAGLAGGGLPGRETSNFLGELRGNGLGAPSAPGPIGGGLQELSVTPTTTFALPPGSLSFGGDPRTSPRPDPFTDRRRGSSRSGRRLGGRRRGSVFRDQLANRLNGPVISGPSGPSGPSLRPDLAGPTQASFPVGPTVTSFPTTTTLGHTGSTLGPVHAGSTLSSFPTTSTLGSFPATSTLGSVPTTSTFRSVPTGPSARPFSTAPSGGRGLRAGPTMPGRGFGPGSPLPDGFNEVLYYEGPPLPGEQLELRDGLRAGRGRGRGRQGRRAYLRGGRYSSASGLTASLAVILATVWLRMVAV